MSIKLTGFMKHLIFTLLILTAVVVPGRPRPTCFCVFPEVADSFARADAVFVGKVLEIERTSATETSKSERLFAIKFKVEKSWKGDSEEQRVLAAQGDLGCFIYPVFSKGERYLVYADPAYFKPKRNKVLVVNLCNRTAALPLPGLRVRSGDGYDDIPILEKIAFRKPTS